MPFKYSCIVLLISVAILFVQAKQDKEGESKQNDPAAVHERVKYEGRWIECKDVVKKDQFGMWCGCGWLGCTAHSRCTTNSIVCDLKRDVNEIDFNDMKRGRDCKCDFL